jgi:RNA polymerase sigma-32 factor
MSLSLLTPNQKMLTPDEEASLISEWITHRDNKTLMRLIRAFSPLVSKFVRKYAAYGIPKEELLSVGNLALIETAHRFKPEKGFKFSTYSSHWIKGTMLIFIASNYFAFTLKSQKMKHVFFKLRRLMHETNNSNGQVDIHEMMDKLSEHFGLSPTKLEQIYELIQKPMISLQQPTYSQGDREAGQVTFDQTIPTEDPDPETQLIDKRLDAFRKSILYTTMEEVLNDRERIIIRGQMLAEPDNVQTLQDLADTFKLSRERVRQIRNNALEKLNRAIRAKCQDIEPQALF